MSSNKIPMPVIPPKRDERDAYRKSLEDLCPHMFDSEIPENLEPYKKMTVPELLLEIFPEELYSAEEREHIVYGETGFPGFFDLRLGKNGFEVFIRQLWNARARREFRYANCEILEEDPYAGVVNHIKFFTQDDPFYSKFCRLRIDIGTDTSIMFEPDGSYKITHPDETTFEGKASPNAPIIERTWADQVAQINKFLVANEVTETFEKFLNDLGYEYSSKIPMEIFFKWLSAMAEIEEAGEIDPEVKDWIEGELKKFFTD